MTKVHSEHVPLLVLKKYLNSFIENVKAIRLQFRDAIYSTAKHQYYPNDLTDDGLQVSDVLNVLKQFYVLDSDMPYDMSNFQSCLRPVPEDAKKTDFVIQDYVSVNPTVEEIKLALFHHGVVAIGIDWQNEWMNPVNGILQPQNTTSDGGHCVALVGYNDNIEIPDGTKGAFYLVNNWSKQWAKGGYAWLPYSSNTLPMNVFTIKA